MSQGTVLPDNRLRAVYFQQRSWSIVRSTGKSGYRSSHIESSTVLHQKIEVTVHKRCQGALILTDESGNRTSNRKSCTVLLTESQSTVPLTESKSTVHNRSQGALLLTESQSTAPLTESQVPYFNRNLKLRYIIGAKVPYFNRSQDRTSTVGAAYFSGYALPAENRHRQTRLA